MAPKKDITGQRFGRLVAIERTEQKNVHGYKWLCACDCGNIALVVLAYMMNGHTKSCGCLNKENAKKAKWSTHGHTRNGVRANAHEYAIWSTMKQRCLNPKTASYRRYGGRGISIDPSWLGVDGFLTFYRDMGPRPSSEHSIDRIDANGNYTKDNCRWATSREQNNNRSGIRRITYQGETLTSAEWGRRTGLRSDTIRNRLDMGWDAERALTTPSNGRKRH